jgi:hypothetical protein
MFKKFEPPSAPRTPSLKDFLCDLSGLRGKFPVLGDW